MCGEKPSCACALACCLVSCIGCNSSIDEPTVAAENLSLAATDASGFVNSRDDNFVGGDQSFPGGLAVWAAHVIDFSSQYDEYYWSAEEALGLPDTRNYGYPTAWAPAMRNGTQEFITLGFNVHLFVNGVTIRETDGNGFVFQVDLLDLEGESHTVWTGTDPSLPGSPASFRLEFDATDFRVSGVRIHVDTDHNSTSYEEIDAVAVHGTRTKAARSIDCNSNGLDDTIELADGLVSDCDFNNVPDECESDSDNDGLIDACDACPDSDDSATLTLNGCDSGVANLPLSDGCWMAEQLAACVSDEQKHGRYVSCIAHLTNAWKREGLITGKEKGRVQRCASRQWTDSGDIEEDATSNENPCSHHDSTSSKDGQCQPNDDQKEASTRTPGRRSR